MFAIVLHDEIDMFAVYLSAVSGENRDFNREKENINTSRAIRGAVSRIKTFITPRR